MSEKKFQDNIYKELKIDKDIAFGFNKEYRLNVLNFIEHKVDKKFNKNIRIAELGCGTGYFSAYILRKYKDVTLDMYDISSSVEVGIKKVMEISGINPKRYKFYSTDTNQNFKSNYYDIIFTCGALHHSYSLYKYFKSVQEALKLNGLLVSQEPAYSETLSGHELRNLYKKRLNMKSMGEKPLHERYDFFFRISEYLVTARFAGLDLFYIKEWNQNMNHPELYVGSKFSNNILLKLIKYILKAFLNIYRNKKFSFLQKIKKLPKNYLLIFKKSNLNIKKEWYPHLDILGLSEDD